MRSSRSLPLLADQGSLKGSVRLDGLHCERLPPQGGCQSPEGPASKTPQKQIRVRFSRPVLNIQSGGKGLIECVVAEHLQGFLEETEMGLSI